jgi:hypothetical protein
MKISEKDFMLLTGMVEFHFKFSEYIRENDSEMFFRAIDYAKTFTEAKGVSFDYWHEDNKRFLHELYTIIHKRKNNLNKLIDKVGDKDKATDMWMKKKNTSKEDLLGMKKYIENFIRHARELNYDDFDMTDWVNFTNICKTIKDDPKFIEFATGQIKRVLGSDSELLKEFNNEEG